MWKPVFALSEEAPEIHLKTAPRRWFLFVSFVLGVALSLTGLLIIWDFGSPPTIATLSIGICLLYAGGLVLGVWFLSLGSSKATNVVQAEATATKQLKKRDRRAKDFKSEAVNVINAKSEAGGTFKHLPQWV